METSASASPITDEWVTHHFDHLSPELARAGTARGATSWTR